MPRIANEITVKPLYNQETELVEVIVLWREVVISFSIIAKGYES